MAAHVRPQRARLAASSPSAPAWSDVLAAFTDAVIVTDRQRRIVLFNPAAEELTGWPQRRAAGEDCQRVFADTPQITEIIDRVQAQGQSESRGEEHVMRSGRRMPVRIICLPLWNDADHVSGAVLVIHDLGYQKTLEEAARRNENLARLGTMVAGLAHEVRNPLAGIKGAAQLLAARVGATPDLTECTEVITREVDRLSALVEDLLTLGSPSKPRLVPLNIHRVIQEVVAIIGPELDRAGLRLQFAFDPSLPDVDGDEAQLNQVFLNVLRNAAEAMTASGAIAPAGNTISIGTRMETDFHILRGSDRARTFLRVEVADQGVGIDAQTAGHIFEPFFTTKPRGTGLGLAISSKIVAEHGGIIRATPRHPAGTVITITLPVAKP